MRARSGHLLRRLWVHMGYDVLSPAFRRFLGLYVVFSAAGILSGTFFNIFLLRATGSSTALMVYNLLLAVVQPLMMMLSVYTVRHWSVLWSQRIGFALQALSYLLLGIMMHHAEAFVLPVSIMLASSNSFFFASYTPQVLSYTNDAQRDVAYGAINFLSMLLGMVFPVLTGFFISSFGDLTGYRLLFFLSAAMGVACFGLSWRLAPVTGLSAIRRTQFRRTARLLFTNGLAVSAMVSTLINATRISVVAYFGSLLSYALIGRESSLGIISFVSSLVGLAATLAYGRLVRPGTRGRWMMAGVALLLASIAWMLLDRSALTYTIYCLVGAVVGIFVDNPPLMSYMAVLQHEPALGENGAEVHSLREFFCGGGRALGLLPVFFLKDPQQLAVWMLFAVTLIQVIAALSTHHIDRALQGRDGVE